MDEIISIDIRDIVAGQNDRTRFDSNGLAELADSIRENGLIQPITVRPIGNLYQIVAGERRFRAACQAGLADVPCIVRELDDEQAAAVMLLENVSRADLDPIDEANAYQTRMDQFGWTVEDIAVRAGVSPIRVQFRIKLLALREDLRELVRSGNLPIGYAQILADAALDPNRQTIALRVLRENQSPTPAWFRRIVSELAEEQAQEGLFGLEALATEVVEKVGGSTTEQLPLPRTDKAPAGTLAEQAAFWRDAAEAWDALGKNFKRNECLAAAAALEAAA